MKLFKEIEALKATQKMQINHLIHTQLKEHVAKCNVSQLRQSFKRAMDAADNCTFNLKDEATPEEDLLHVMAAFMGE